MNDLTPARAKLRVFIVIAAIAMGATLALAFAQEGRWSWSAAALILTAIALVGQQGGWYERIGGVVFAVSVAMAMVALWDDRLNLWSSTSAAASLVLWDLDHLQRRLVSVDHIENAHWLIMQHLRRLLVTVGFGLGLGTAALLVPVDYSFGTLLLLSVLLAIGLTQAVKLLRTESD
ncbi:MAG: hypothetical protein ACP5HG_07555 [Anaerolineae bacterium]